ncbi:hypothetical protein DFH27DRAFT_579230 [Peziza echinospora]|nr:hypothetical protein DFH27DRAFT_579230 [Peziza echinospora]
MVIQQYTIIPHGLSREQPILVAPVNAYLLFFEVEGGMDATTISKRIGALLAEKADLNDDRGICRVSVDPRLRCGYIAFFDKATAEISEEFFPVNWVTVTDWLDSQWPMDVDGTKQKLIEETQRDIDELEAESTAHPDAFSRQQLRMQKNNLSDMNAKLKSWVPPPERRMKELEEDLVEEDWSEEVEKGLRKALEDLREKEIFAWDACRSGELVYHNGSLIGLTSDAIKFTDINQDNYPNGVWLEEVFGEYGGRKATITLTKTPSRSCFHVTQQYRNPSVPELTVEVLSLFDTGAVDPSILPNHFLES